MLIALVTAMFLAGGGATYDLFGKDAQKAAEFDQMFAQAQSLRSEAQESFLDVVFAIQEKVTAEQWKAAFSEALGGEREP